MKKEAYYFSHDANAHRDSKIIALRMKHNWAGYGLYWAVVEKLRESTGYKLPIRYNELAFDLRADAGTLKSIVEDFGLFVIESDCFYSERLTKSMELAAEKSGKARESAKKRWVDADALQTHSDSNANKEKERKLKEIKGKENILQPYQPPPNLSHADFANQLLSENGGLDKESIEVQTRQFITTEVLKLFHANLITQEKVHKTFAEYKQHLANWIIKRPVIKVESKPKSKPFNSQD